MRIFERAHYYVKNVLFINFPCGKRKRNIKTVLKFYASKVDGEWDRLKVNDDMRQET